EIVSPGGFPNGITLDDVFDGRSELRNRILANVMKELGYIESWGSGVARIKSVCEKNGVEFIITEKGDFVKVVFKRPDYSLKTTFVESHKTAKDRKRPQETVRDRKRPQESANISLDARDILNYLNKREKISRKEVMAILNCKETKAKNTLKEMVNQKLLLRIQKGKYTYYVKS
ncbi:MAG: ATP-dependent DNA helicase, partial [Chlorobi bacterium]|nr:ATP-dependent DNA helicase [Chlorobiota bacterium]